ncbi:unnamed protein product [Discosporangium mesarthrocarpum]
MARRKGRLETGMGLGMGTVVRQAQGLLSRVAAGARRGGDPSMVSKLASGLQIGSRRVHSRDAEAVLLFSPSPSSREGGVCGLVGCVTHMDFAGWSSHLPMGQEIYRVSRIGGQEKLFFSHCLCCSRQTLFFCRRAILLLPPPLLPSPPCPLPSRLSS